MPQEIKDQLKEICKEYSYRAVLEAIADEYYQEYENPEDLPPRRLRFVFEVASESGVWFNEEESCDSQSMIKNEDSF